MKHVKLQFYIEVAITTALAMVLELVSYFSFTMPQGGTVSFSMLPIFIMAYRWGVKGGLLTGFLFGILQLIVSRGHIYHPIQGVIDYFVAFTVVGLSGIFFTPIQDKLQSGLKKEATIYMITGVFIGSLARYLAHVISGFVFFASYAPEGQSPILYSAIYNATYMIPTYILCAILTSMLLLTAPRLVKATI